MRFKEELIYIYMTINIPILIQQCIKYNGYRRCSYGLKDVRL